MDGTPAKVVSKENPSHLLPKVDSQTGSVRLSHPLSRDCLCSSRAAVRLRLATMCPQSSGSHPAVAPGPCGQLSWWVREARTLPGPSPPTGRIGRLAQHQATWRASESGRPWPPWPGWWWQRWCWPQCCPAARATARAWDGTRPSMARPLSNRFTQHTNNIQTMLHQQLPKKCLQAKSDKVV